MRAEIVAATNALEGFASHVESFWSSNPWHHMNGSWNTPPLSNSDMESRSRRLAARLAALKDEAINPHLLQRIVNLPDQITWFQANTLPQLPNNNFQVVHSIFDSIMSNVEQALPVPGSAPSWEEVAGSNLIPARLAKRIRNLEAALARIEPRAGDLEGKIETIEEAHATATDLPADLQALKEARDDVVAYKNQTVISANDAFEAKKRAAANLLAIEEQYEAAEKIMANIEHAYSAATTKGLAAAFKKRADHLSASTWVWVAFLFTALAIGGALGLHRLQSFQELVSTPSADARWIWLEAIMSLLALAAPVWFAWLSTRQIGQRFKLAEDYGFKAAVAQAYEGYRKEAARLDPNMEARLFASALDRLEEPPSRFLPQIDHNSPYEALLESAGFQRALERVSGLKEMAQAVLDKVPSAPKPETKTSSGARRASSQSDADSDA